MARVAVFFCLLLAVAGVASDEKSTSSEGKIIGGKPIDISEVPYQVSLQYYYEHICGASIIGPKHILSAGHCVERGTPSDYSIRAGSSYNAKEGETRTVRKITSHPKYNPVSVNNEATGLELNESITNSNSRIMPWKNKFRGRVFDYDIAILELAEPLEFNEKIKPIPLAEKEPRPGDEVLLSGWGADIEGGGATDRLLSVTVPVINKQSCQRSYLRYNTITENMFCAGYMSGGRDTCQGDSGGPAVVKGRQAGVVSWGRGCARRNNPGVYTNIAKLRKWIQAQTAAISDA